MSDSPAVEEEGPAFVVYVSWRSSGPVAGTDLDRLADSLADIDPEVCLQSPSGEEAFVVSLGSSATSSFDAAVECTDHLLGAAAALGIDAEVVEAVVCTESTERWFRSSDLPSPSC